MISVCMATYNGEQYITEQLASIIPQLSNEDEIIISDDGSTDHTLERIRSLHCPLISIYTNQREHGYTANFENALQKARGDYIFLSDQDDVWAEDKVQVCLDALQHSALVVTDADLIDGTGKPISDSFFSLRHPRRGLMGNLIKFGYLGCCLAFRREVAAKALPFPPNHRLCTHDNWLFLIAQAFFRVTVLPRPLLHYRRHQGNTSAGSVNLHKGMMFRIAYRLYLIRHLISRR